MKIVIRYLSITMWIIFIPDYGIQEWEAQPHAHLNANFKSINIC